MCSWAPQSPPRPHQLFPYTGTHPDILSFSFLPTLGEISPVVQPLNPSLVSWLVCAYERGSACQSSFVVVCAGLCLMQSTGSLHWALEVLFFGGVAAGREQGNLRVKTCLLKLWIIWAKAGWLLRRMMDSLQWEMIFCNISLEFCIIRHEKPRLKIGGQRAIFSSPANELDELYWSVEASLQMLLDCVCPCVSLCVWV